MAIVGRLRRGLAAIRGWHVLPNKVTRRAGSGIDGQQVLVTPHLHPMASHVDDPRGGCVGLCGSISDGLRHPSHVSLFQKEGLETETVERPGSQSGDFVEGVGHNAFRLVGIVAAVEHEHMDASPHEPVEFDQGLLLTALDALQKGTEGVGLRVPREIIELHGAASWFKPRHIGGPEVGTLRVVLHREG